MGETVGSLINVSPLKAATYRRARHHGCLTRLRRRGERSERDIYGSGGGRRKSSGGMGLLWGFFLDGRVFRV
ncbi:hypothetical protein COLO4_30164 [Corchorus olitorius]|uniref:Uncharacterized protein n=1 Tax=Corchorus olitorius TaxID=93759 RepID=A0A1R3HB00_9ROSI|nr:hypothetical protein COLO4_30164 [Corchorus olitorius]